MTQSELPSTAFDIVQARRLLIGTSLGSVLRDLTSSADALARRVRYEVEDPVKQKRDFVADAMQTVSAIGFGTKAVQQSGPNDGNSWLQQYSGHKYRAFSAAGKRLREIQNKLLANTVDLKVVDEQQPIRNAHTVGGPQATNSSDAEIKPRTQSVDNSNARTLSALGIDASPEIANGILAIVNKIHLQALAASVVYVEYYAPAIQDLIQAGLPSKELDLASQQMKIRGPDLAQILDDLHRTILPLIDVPEPKHEATNAPNSGKCFIATAACGGPNAIEVKILREFRDAVLSRSIAGRRAIAIYERYSPKLALFIEDRNFFRMLVRLIIVRPLACIYLLFR